METLSSKSVVRVAAILVGMAVACGAFGAHGLRDVVTPERLAVWEKAVLYQLVHGVALLALGLAGDSAVAFLSAAKVMIFGILIFSGSLYLLVLTNTGWLGAITPIGGVAIIVAWGMIGVAAKAR